MRKVETRKIDAEDFKKRFGAWAVIAGASEGSGACYAAQLAAMGLNLVLISRRADALTTLGNELATAHGVAFRVLPVDLKREDAAETILAGTADIDVGLYISNAGTDGAGHGFLDQPVQRARDLLTMNARTVIDAVHGFGNRFKARGGGGIILMASGAGLGGQPWLAMYAATKAFEINLAESLWAEFEGGNISILGVGAPMMDTPALRRSLAGMELDFPYIKDPAEIVSQSLAALGGDPLLLFPDGPDAATIPQIQADRKARLVALAEWAKAYTAKAKAAS